MFDIAPSEFLLIAIVAVVVIGPKDLPMALRTAGRWVARIRRVSGHFRSGIETMIREAEMEEMEKKWREQNAAIMAAHPNPEPTGPEPTGHEPAGPEHPSPEHTAPLPLDPAVVAHAPTEPLPAAPAPAPHTDHPA